MEKKLLRKYIELRKRLTMHEVLITINPNIHKNLKFSNYDDLEKTPPKVCTYSAESGEAFLLQEVDPNHNMLGLGHFLILRI